MSSPRRAGNANGSRPGGHVAVADSLYSDGTEVRGFAYLVYSKIVQAVVRNGKARADC